MKRNKKTQQVNFRTTPAMREELVIASARCGASIGWIIRDAIYEWLHAHAQVRLPLGGQK